MSIPISLRGDFKASQLRALARKTKDGPQAQAAFGAGGHLRWGDPHRGGEDWRRDAADHSGLGDAV